MRRLIDQSGLFTRSECARLLDVSESALSLWVNGGTVPRPEVLHRLWHLARSSGRLSAGTQEAFEAMVNKPAAEVSARLGRRVPTVRAYLLEGARQHWLSDLTSLPPGSQEELLGAAFKLLERVRAGGPVAEAPSAGGIAGVFAKDAAVGPGELPGPGRGEAGQVPQVLVSYLLRRLPRSAPAEERPWGQLYASAFELVSGSSSWRNSDLAEKLLEAPNLPVALREHPWFLGDHALPAWGYTDGSIQFWPQGRGKPARGGPAKSVGELEELMRRQVAWSACYGRRTAEA